MSLAVLTNTDIRLENRHVLPDLNKMQARAHDKIIKEISRIVEMPITQPLTDEEIEAVSKYYLSAEAYQQGERLRGEQALAMVHYHDYGGIFCTLGVGCGKTLISFMTADECYKEIICKRQAGDISQEARVLLVVQANLLSKFENDAPFMRWFLKSIPPYFILKGTNKRQRTILAKSGRRGLYVCSYHTLSSRDASDILEAINPACIICDEAQNVAGNKNSARAKRFKSFVQVHRPRIIPLSGTMTRKSIMEYSFLATHALGEYNFLPNIPKLAEEWAAVLDSASANMGDFRHDMRPRPGPITELTNWCRMNFPDIEMPSNLIGVRRAFAQRMQTTPGVIGTAEGDDIGTALIFYNNTIPNKEQCTGWDALQQHLEILLEDFQTPSGEILACAMNVWGYRYQMEATGFYYDLYWRTPAELAEHRHISMMEATDVLVKSKKSHELHRGYTKALREWIKTYSRTHLDTPALIGHSMHRFGSLQVGEYLYSEWRAWKESMFPELEVRQQRPVRVCDFKIQAVVADILQNKKKGGIIWYHHAEMGKWILEVLQEHDIPATHCPRGDMANKFLADTHGMQGTFIVASLVSHSVGKDLQHGFCNNYYLQMPISATLAEQSIGRTYRMGQKAEEASYYFYLSTPFDNAHFNLLLSDTAYVQQSTGSQMKLLIGTYTFRPKSVPYTALAEMGAPVSRSCIDNKILEGILGQK